MRKVSGFLADDGTFFDTKEDADLYDAIAQLRFCVTQIGANPDKVMIVVDGTAEQIRRYLDAKENYTKRETDDHAGVRGSSEGYGESEPAAPGTIHGRNEYNEPVSEPSYAAEQLRKQYKDTDFTKIAEEINARGYDPATAPGLTADERCAATPIPSIIDSAIDPAAEIEPVSVFQQQIDSSKYVPHMGSREFTEAVHDGLTLDGIRGGGSDAPSIRSDTDMAVGEEAKIIRSRRRSRSSNIRNPQVGEAK